MNGNQAVGGYCGCWTIVMLINALIGGWSFDYCLYSILGKDIPWFGDMICGLFLGEVTVPLAIVCWVMRLCGVEVPFVK
jgi:hypothetical protein